MSRTISPARRSARKAGQKRAEHFRATSASATATRRRPWGANLYKHIKKSGDFTDPGPSETWVYLDETGQHQRRGFFQSNQFKLLDRINRPPITIGPELSLSPTATPKFTNGKGHS